MACIYCLYSTLDHRPRYVGQTTKVALIRVSQHVREAQRSPSTRLHLWIRGTLRDGYEIRAHVLQWDVHPADLNRFERYWISQFTDLLNGVQSRPADTAIGRLLREGLRREQGRANSLRSMTEP